MKKYVAEFIGIFWLVLGGCGSAVLAAAFPELGIGFVGVALAFGLTVLTMAYAIGHISGYHLNPAVSIGLWAGGRFPAKELAPYVIVQVIGSTAAAGVLYLIATGKAGFTLSGGFASNGYGIHSPGGYSMFAALVCEAVMTMMFLFVIMGATRQKGSFRLCAFGHRALPHPDTSDQHPGHQHLREPCTEHGRGDFCRRMGRWPTLAVLGRPDCGWHSWGLPLPIHRKHEGLIPGFESLSQKLDDVVTVPFTFSE